MNQNLEVKIIADSLAPSGRRLTTFVLTYARHIHSEFMTHRTISRNAQSSRAVPTAKMIQRVRESPVVPFFGENRPGMQDNGALPEEEARVAKMMWLNAADRAAYYAEELAELKVHKQAVNRILEPFSTITVVATATSWDNFFKLRCSPMADPMFQELAYEMRRVYEAGTPEILTADEWHLPFVRPEEKRDWETKIKIMASIARCARVSFLSHDGINSLERDINRAEQLIFDGHWSPTEHQAKASIHDSPSGNLRGFVQYRQLIAGANNLE